LISGETIAAIKKHQPLDAIPNRANFVPTSNHSHAVSTAGKSGKGSRWIGIMDVLPLIHQRLPSSYNLPGSSEIGDQTNERVQRCIKELREDGCVFLV
jgi:hypothetical protein